MSNKILLILLLIVVVIGTGFGFYFRENKNQSKRIEETETPEISENAETPKPEKIKDNDLIMDVIKRESGVSQELLASSCVSSIMQETEDLIVVYIRWTCSDVGGGARAILKKQGVNYKFITMLQDWPSCDLMEEFSVPQSFYEMCY
jgi:hypothetical protein